MAKDPEYLHQSQLQDHQNHLQDHQNQLQELQNPLHKQLLQGGLQNNTYKEPHLGELLMGGVLKLLKLILVVLGWFWWSWSCLLLPPPPSPKPLKCECGWLIKTLCGRYKVLIKCLWWLCRAAPLLGYNMLPNNRPPTD